MRVGLECARQLGFKGVELLTDSLTVANEIPKREDLGMFEEGVAVRWIPREKNSTADRLSKRALETDASTRT